MLVFFFSKHAKRDHKLELTCFCLLDNAYRAPFPNMKVECQRWPEMPVILGRSGTYYVAMVTKLLSSYCGTHLLESYCKEWNISDTNWLRYIFSYLIKIWLSVWHHHLANLQILKTWEKEILRTVNSISLYVSKWLWSERCDFRLSTTLM